MDLSNENIVHIKTKNNEYIQFKRLLEYKDILIHAYSLGKNLNFRTSTIKKEKLPAEEYNHAINSYKLLCDSIDCDYKNLVKTNQEHTDCVKIVSRKIKDGEPDFNLKEYFSTDGLITDKKDLILSTTNADCILLLFFDPVKKVIANTHSGWKGTLKRISVKTVEKMIEEYNCNPSDIICCICPSIRKCHFEVEKDVKNLFEKEFKDLENLNDIVEEKVPNDKWNIDTVLINQMILEKMGLKKENIIDSGICSVCNSNIIHSFRVEKEGYGLSTAVIELK